MGKLAPDELRDERHDRVKQAQRGVEDKEQVAQNLCALRPLGTHRGLAALDVPVAQLVPEERVQGAGVVGEEVLVKQGGHVAHKLAQAREDPGVGVGLHLGIEALEALLDVGEHEAARVVDLRDERLGGLGAGRAQELLRLLVDVGVETHVLVRGDQAEQAKAHGVGAVHAHEVHGVDAVALGLGHAAAVLGQNRGVDHDVMEGNLMREVQRAHDHAGDPQGDDVAGGDEGARGMVLGELGRVVGPALRRKGPQLAGEPGVEHVLVLMHMVAAALGAHVHVVHEGVFPAAVLAVENGDAMAPPQLARDAPVLEVLHPGEVGLLPALRVEAHLAGLHDVGGRALELVDGDEPLLGEPRLERGVATIAMHDRVLDVLDVVEQAVLLEPCHNGLAGLVAGHTGELAVALDNDGMLVEDVDLGQVVGGAHGVVVGVVGGGHLDEAGAEVSVDVVVGENRDLAVDDGQHDRLAHELCLVGIGGAHGNAGVAQHRLGARGGHDDVLDAVDGLGERVTQVPEVRRLAAVLGLVVGDGRGAVGAPVHDTLATVDEAVVVPVAEDLAHRLGVAGVHGEALALKVDRAAHALDLVDDDAAVLMRPVPAGVDELLAADLEARDALGLELLVHLGLGRDAGVVGTEDPAGGVALHAVVTNDGVLDGVVEGVAHVEHARDVGRGNGDGAVAHALGATIGAGLHPHVDKLGFHLLRVVVLGHLFHDGSLTLGCGLQRR